MWKAKNSSMLSRFTALVVLAVVLMLVACATGAQQTSHQFSFDGRKDGWFATIDLLEYSYGDKYYPVRDSLINRDDSLYKGNTSIPPQSNVNGPMPVGDFMYVKWRIKSTGEVLEDRVNLRDRLPRDMKDHGLTFAIDGRQLYLYVLTPQVKKSKDEPPVLRTWLSKYNVGYEIYPTFAKR